MAPDRIEGTAKGRKRERREGVNEKIGDEVRGWG